ncbi:MAG: chromosome segregation protein SMC [Clostridia bacterium]|nr:chromosome segregation protein SMC [Clostridia bacterium]
MYFRRLEMQGFKSFADKTVLEFGDGITAVVGPNGSGKSNISDAIRWVLGEQSPKTLRGGRMEDVIFSGTENRKPVGYAEVSIIMDNSDGTLNIAYDEVKVTRRLFRSGESEYLINGATCRLKDIHLLFADTGIGKEGYSIIGQGKVDEILSSKSDERRGIFEEASGIMKYRMQKQESERKLASAEQNLLRIDDIISELELQISALKRQAATAQQYLKLRYELRDIEVGVLVDGIRSASAKLEEIKGKYEIVQKQIADNEAMAENVKEENRVKSEQSAKLETEYTAAKERAFELERTAQHITAEIAMNEQRISTVTADRARMEAELEIRAGRTGEQKLRIEELEKSSEKFQADLEAVSKELEEACEALRELVNAISGDSEKVAAANKEYVEKKLEAGRRMSAADALKAQIEIYEKRITELDGELGRSSDETRQAEEKAAALKAQFDEAADKLEAANKNLEACEKTVDGLYDAIDAGSAHLSDVLTAINSAEAQVKLLSEMEENFEGYAKSVKEILTLCRENKSFGRGIHGAVAQIIKVEKIDELAVETALGNAYQDIVTETEEEAKQAIEYLRQNRLGRATFLPLTAVSGRTMERDTFNKLKVTSGFVGIAAELVEYDSKFENIVYSLLGKVAVFEDLDTAIAAARKFSYGFMCVTRQGDILRTSGAITGGSPEKNNRGGALSRTREIPELQKLIENGKRKAETMRAEQKKLQAQLDEEEALKEVLSEEIRELQVSCAALGAELKSVMAVADTAAQHRATLVSEIETQNVNKEASEKAIGEFRAEAETLLAEAKALEESIAALEEGSKILSEKREKQQNDITVLRLKQSDVQNKIDRCNEELARLTSELEYAGEYSETVLLQIEEAKKTAEELAVENKVLKDNLEKADKDKATAGEHCRKLFEEKKAVDEDLKGMIEKISEFTTAVGYLREEAGRLDVRRMRSEHEYDYNNNRLWEEYELTYTKALEITGGETPENLEECKKHIAELRSGIKRLGNVNVEAIEELDRTQERYDFLTVQRKDVEETRQKLSKVIGELTQVMQKQFKEQFAIIRENFKVVFSELFGGGKADIILSDESDVLESGIEIQAQPPGKKLQNMMLLSGGERALTAIALLFGILRMRPTPFCMLDEIESALDDANVYRFANYTKALSKDTQLILISHRKGTMESADALYGVTMEEKGVSRVLSVKV